MANNSKNYNRIVKNTFVLYVRMLIIMGVSLYTVRALLMALGQEDYGLFNVIGGIVVMFSFLTHVLSSASQRFFAFELGEGDYEKLSKTYSAILFMYAVVVAFIILLAETVGLWFLHNKMTIPESRMYAADFVYQFSILSFCWKILTSPHQAIIIAHEKMNIYAYVAIAESLLQLALVLVLQRVSHDRLIVYSGMMFLIAFLVNTIYIVYARLRYKEIRLVRTLDKTIVHQVVSYSGWTLFGALASVVRSQGINIILNVYFSPVVNAARGVAHNVNGAVSSFSGNFYTAVKPQIVKYYARKNYDACYQLVFRSTKFSFYLLLLFITPIFIYTPEILKLWLGTFPDYTVVFTRLIMIVALIESLANPLITFNQATGNIRMFQLVISSLYIANLPLSILVFELGAGPVAAFITSIAISATALIARLLIINKEHGFPLWSYCKSVLNVLALVITTSVIAAVAYLPIQFNTGNISGLFANIIIVMILVASISLFLGFNASERIYIKNLIISKITHKKYENNNS